MDSVTTGVKTQRGLLWAQLVARTSMAQATGHQYSLPTHGEWFEENGLHYLVRIVENLSRKDKDRLEAAHKADEQAHPFSPFLPPEEDLYVSDLSATHFSVLNKFNVLDHHLLVVTREFEEQDTPLNSADFDALWKCLSDFPALGFYNGGADSGASQRHKHLQVIPLDSGDPCHWLPWLEYYDRDARAGEITRVPELTFPHALTGLAITDSDTAGVQLEAAYWSLIEQLAWYEGVASQRTPRPYNLLVSPDWMVLVPRSRECWDGVSLNALAFIGALLVRSEEQRDALRKVGLLEALKAVCAEPPGLSQP